MTGKYKELYDEESGEKELRIRPATSPKLLNSTQANVTYSTWVVFQVVAFYWVTSLAVVFLNKHIMSTSEYKFPFPIFVTWFQIVVAFVLLVLWGRLGASYRVFSLVPPFEFDLVIARKVLPLTLVYVGMLAANNLCLRDVEVTFYQVARSLSILFQIFFTYALLHTPTSRWAIISCFVVFIGFILGSIGEANFTWIGLLYGVTSSIFVALYGIYVKKALEHVNNDQWRLLHYNTTLAMFLLLPFSFIFGEIPALFNTYFLGDMNFWWIMILAGVTGFLINISVFLQIKFTSPLTNTISGTAKACVQTILAWLIFQNEITVMNGYGILISLGGSALYSYVRYKKI